jgi:hypothetical protein
MSKETFYKSRREGNIVGFTISSLGVFLVLSNKINNGFLGVVFFDYYSFFICSLDHISGCFSHIFEQHFLIQRQIKDITFFNMSMNRSKKISSRFIFS